MSANFQDFVKQFQVIIGHGPNCNDGATAMWAVWRTLDPEYRNQLAQEGGFYAKPAEYKSVTSSSVFEPFIHPNSPEGGIKLQEKQFHTVFVFSQPNEIIPDRLVVGKNVLVLDLDLGEALVPLVKAANFVFVCDHHDSTTATIERHSDFLSENQHKFAQYIDTRKQESGASLAWKLTNSAIIPPFVQVVRIGDTWQWQDYPELQAKHVLRALFIRRAFRSFPDIEDVYQNWDSNFQSYVDQGQIIGEYESSLINQAAKQCDLGYIQTNDGRVYTVAYTQANILRSEIGASMKWYAESRFKVPIDFCATWSYVSRRRMVLVSLRDPAPGINLGAIARNVKDSAGTGGGHVEAAGFSFYGLDRFEKYILTVHPNLSLSAPVGYQQPSPLSTE